MNADAFLRSLLVSVCFACGLLPAASAADEVSPRRADEIPEAKLITLDDLTIKLPIDWAEIPQTETLLTARSPKEDPSDTFLENLRLKSYPLAKPTSLDRILEVQKAEALTQFKIVGTGEVNAPGKPAGPDHADGTGARMLWLAISPKSPTSPDDELTKIDFLLERGDRLYVLHFMTASDHFDRHFPQFKTIAESVTFTKPYTPHPKATSTTATDARAPAESEARNQGRRVGQYTAYALVAAVAIWGAYVLLSRLMAR